MLYYFAYGSNMSPIQTYLRTKDAFVTPIGIGYLKYHELAFRGSSRKGYYATIKKAPGETSHVPVVCYAINEDAEKVLDEAEGIENGFYHKEVIEVSVLTFQGTRETYRGITYVMDDIVGMTASKPGSPRINYVARILSGYKTFDINPLYIWTALQKSTSNKDKADLLMREAEDMILEWNFKKLFDAQAFLGAGKFR